MSSDTKYGIVTDEFGKIPAEEPVFVLRGQDVLAPVAIENYANLLRAAALGLTFEDGSWTAIRRERVELLRKMADDVSNVAATMVAWQSKHGAKLPD